MTRTRWLDSSNHRTPLDPLLLGLPRTGNRTVKLKQTGPWIEHSGPDADVVVSSRARLARNLSGLPFVNQATDSEKREVLQLVQTLPLAGDRSEELLWIDLQQSTPEDRRLLFERHLDENGHAVVNADDPAAPHFEAAAQAAGAALVRVSRGDATDAEVRLESAEVRMDGTSARVRLPSGVIDLSLPLVGDFNIENMLVACGVCVGAGDGAGDGAGGWSEPCDPIPIIVSPAGSSSCRGVSLGGAGPATARSRALLMVAAAMTSVFRL